jgi:hypothetical protein
MANEPSRNGRTPQGGSPSDARDASLRRELPVIPDDDEDDFPDAELTYIAYGERGDDVAFELSESLEEIVEIYESMKEDGFAVKIFQAQELEIVATPE